jgi:hypothetical protein
MKEVIEHLERMAETLDGVDEENWLDTPNDIANIYRSVANEIKKKMAAQNQSVTNCNQLQHNKVENAENNLIRLNAAKCKKLLGEVYVLLDKSKSYIIDVESIDRRREFSHYLTRAKNLVDNIISQELGANVSVGNTAAMREALELMLEWYYERHDDVAAMDAAMEKARAALAAPPRNCDVFSKAEVFKELKDRSFSKEDTIEWLYAEAKGDN